MTSLRVATYNIYLGADLTLIFGATDSEQLVERARQVCEQLQWTDFAERAEAIARLLVRERVDVVGLQEVARWQRGPLGPDGNQGPSEVWYDFEADLLSTLERAGAPYDVHAVNANFSGSSAVSQAEYASVVGSNLVLVRRGGPVTVTGEAAGDFGRSFDVPTGFDDLALSIRRSWGGIDAAVDGVPFRFLNTHTEAYDADTRDAQRDELLSRIGQSGAPVIVAGDFNALPDQVAMPAPYVDAWLSGDGDGFTCGQDATLDNEVSALSHRIDYLWLRGARATRSYVVGNADGDRTTGKRLWPSDHAGVVAEVEL